MRVIAHPNLCGSPCGCHHGQSFFRYATAVTAYSPLWGAPACWPPYCNEVSQWGRENGAGVARPFQLDQDWFEGEGDASPWCLFHF